MRSILFGFPKISFAESTRLCTEYLSERVSAFFLSLSTSNSQLYICHIRSFNLLYNLSESVDPVAFSILYFGETNCFNHHLANQTTGIHMAREFRAVSQKVSKNIDGIRQN